jgi:hypothetical protein
MKALRAHYTSPCFFLINFDVGIRSVENKNHNDSLHIQNLFLILGKKYKNICLYYIVWCVVEFLKYKVTLTIVFGCRDEVKNSNIIISSLESTTYGREVFFAL